MVRPVCVDDAEAIQAIYEPYVLGTAISFELSPPSVAEMRDRIRRMTGALPWLVYESDGKIAGYAYASKHREREAYQWSVDVTVYVAEAFHRLGIGKALYQSLLDRLPNLGYVNAFAGIALPNEASVALHEALGFIHIGVYKNVGFKLGEWRDVGWWQLSLVAEAQLPKEPVAVQSCGNS